MALLVQLGSYNPVTDGWQMILDLNDGQTLEVDEVGGLDIPTPTLDIYTTANPRGAGERFLRGRYAAREVAVRCTLGPAATEAALAGTLRQLAAVQGQAGGANGAQIAGVSGAPHIALAVQPPGASAPVYADVLALAHDLTGSGDAAAWVRLLHEGLTIELLCAPFWRGPRATLDNLVPNPGMDQPGQVTLWADAATNANYVSGYALNAGSAPTIASNTLTISASADVSFGATNWGAITQWAVAFTAASAGTFTFWLHRSATTTGIQIIQNGAANTLGISTDIAGTVASVASGSVTLTNGTRYWLVASALPAINANALTTLVSAQIYNYSSGAIGTAIGTPLFANVTAAVLQTGQCGFSTSGAALVISTAGGTNPAANSITGIAADSWLASATNGDATAAPSWPGWDATTTYPGGPWASLRALSLTAPPAGKVNATWTGPRGPATGGTQVTGRVWVAQAGLSATASVTLTAQQYTSGGSFISALTLGTATATTIGTGWAGISGTVTLAANCAGINLQIAVADATAGASARATVWLDNAQLNTGTALLPYCANRFAKAPAQIAFSGIAGDVPAPCSLALGVNPAGAGLAAGATLSLFAGRRALAGFGAQLVAGALAAGADGVNQQLTPDGTMWAGIQTIFKGAAANYQPLYLTGTAADYSGVYHLFARLRLHDTPATSFTLQPLSYVTQSPWLGNTAKTDRLGVYQGTPLNPFTNANWAVVDAGQITMPAFPLATGADATLIDVTAAAISATATNQLDSDWGVQYIDQ
ncbi:MAG: hypothetical protein H0X24_02565 [Ktedonobacterales bacterium]|nr:hypothetical protein [Ktedonobacterales bacterium]